jgi:hydrophobic/amphiphilic exporter-1 (mainly G- bacteria), HAE1 family
VAFAYTTLGGEQNDNSPNKGQIYVQLRPKHQRQLSQQQFETELRKALPRFEGVTARVLILGMGGQVYAPIEIDLRGPNLGELQKYSDRSIAALRDVPGLVELKSTLEGRKPEWNVEVDRDAAADVGLSVGTVSSSLRPLLAGQKAGDWEDEDGLAHDVRVRLAPEFRTARADIERVPVSTGRMDPATGRPVMVPLGQIAHLTRGGAPDLIRRKDLERLAGIEANYQGRTLTAVMKDVQTRLGRLNLPPGYRFDYGGEQEDFTETVRNMAEALALAVVFIYLVLASQFGSFLHPLSIMLSLPLSLVGVSLALLSTRGTFNMMSMVGIIMLMGLVTKNAILLVDFANQARRRGADRRRRPDR